MTISIIFPTRTRSTQVKELIDTVETTSDNFDDIEFCIYYDLDDSETKIFLDDLSTKYSNIKYITSNENINLSEMWNYAYSTLATGDIIMHCGDDIRFRTMSWDTIVKNAFNDYDDKIILVHGDDGIQGEGLATHSFVHRKWIEVSGFWLPPYFVSDYNDTWLDYVSRKLNRKVYLSNVYTEHMHFSVGKSSIDENTEKRLSRHNTEKPEDIYNKKENERIEHVEKLQQYITIFSLEKRTIN